MFTRPIARAAAGAGTQFRRYATEAAAPKKGNGLLWAALAAGAGAAGYYGYSQYSAKAAIPSEPAFKGGDQGFFPLKLRKVEDLSHNTKHFTFSFDDPNSESGLSVASVVLTKFTPKDGKAVIRPYTPTSAVTAKGEVDFVIKKYPGGPMTEHLHSLSPGDEVLFKGPLQKFQWVANKYENVAMIAGGTGITPMYQVLRHILANPEDRTKVTLVFGNVTEDDILLRKELSDLESTYPQRFKAYYFLDNPSAGWQGQKGFISKNFLKTVLPEPKEGDKVRVYVCGPPGLYNAISGNKVSPSDQGELTGALKDLGYSKDQVFKF